MGRSSSHEALLVAPEAALACSQNSRKSYSVTPISPSAPRLVVGQEQCPSGTTVSPPSTCTPGVYRRHKRRPGCTLRELRCKRHLVRYRKPPPHKFSGVKSCFSGPQESRASLQGPNCADSNGQHNCSLLHQQRGWYEIRLSLCPPLETSVLVSPQRSSAEGSTHTGSLECDSRQTVPTQPSDSDRVVPLSAGFQSLVLQVGQPTNRCLQSGSITNFPSLFHWFRIRQSGQWTP